MPTAHLARARSTTTVVLSSNLDVGGVVSCSGPNRDLLEFPRVFPFPDFHSAIIHPNSLPIMPFHFSYFWFLIHVRFRKIDRWQLQGKYRPPLFFDLWWFSRVTDEDPCRQLCHWIKNNNIIIMDMGLLYDYIKQLFLRGPLPPSIALLMIRF